MGDPSYYYCHRVGMGKRGLHLAAETTGKSTGNKLWSEYRERKKKKNQFFLTAKLIHSTLTLTGASAVIPRIQYIYYELSSILWGQV